jgi:hypothetical protein
MPATKRIPGALAHPVAAMGRSYESMPKRGSEAVLVIHWPGQFR